MKIRRSSVLCLSILLIALCLIGCGKQASPLSATYSVIRDPDFGAAHLNVSIEDFLDAGFHLGDSLDISFSNGNTLEDIPFYNGYYTKTTMPVVVAYPGYSHIAVAFNNGDPMWEKMELSPEDSAVVTLREAGKYRTVQETFATAYTDERKDYGEDFVFGNFRSLRGGSMKENTFYRGASPIDNQHNRAETVDHLIREAGIRYILDLSDSREKVDEMLVKDPGLENYLFTELMNSDRVGLLNLTSAYRSDHYHTALASGLREMMQHEGPCFIHCVEGKDRTGFVCILLEALCGASYAELEEDYMITYDNYYGITEEKTPEQYRAFVELRLNDLLGYLAGTDNADELENADFRPGARAYLVNGGMTDDEIDDLVRFLSDDAA